MNLERILDLLSRLTSTLTTITFIDIIDMLLLAYIIYKGIKFIRETKAQQLIIGIFILVGIYIISSTFELKVMSFLLENFFQIGILALIIVFQPELRRILERVGRANVKSFSVFGDQSHVQDSDHNWSTAIEAIGEAVDQLSDTNTGALIVIERTIRLGEQIDTGTVLDCQPSVATFGSIFFPKTPLHDGAVIIRDARIHAAGCFLPTPQKEDRINKLLGSRHRAAIGMSENSDAIVIVVSEETGTVSIAENGELTRGYTKERLVQYLRSQLVPDSTHDNKFFGMLRSGKERLNGRKNKKD
ncbi:MAG: diadenylate cyclase CdaA [Oscillospiraceae bacterium]|nr:diadenylate cyclase CdaA [Oscillospiraceae bacterium]